MIEIFIYTVISIIYILLNALVILDEDNNHGGRTLAQFAIITMTVVITVLDTKGY